jgi:hypothetical protein
MRRTFRRYSFNVFDVKDPLPTWHFFSGQLPLTLQLPYSLGRTT